MVSQPKEKFCYELKIYMEEEQKDILSSLLGELNIHDFIFGSIDCDIEAEYDPALVKHDYYTDLAQNSPAIIYSEDKKYLESVQKALEQLLPSVGIPCHAKTFSISPIPNQNWEESWKDSFVPIDVKGVFAILPPWENKNSFSQPHKIIIDPGMAFGTGQHETTRLCLEALLKYQMPEKVLDVGTGSGILAIAASMLGAKYILGNDIDSTCIDIAKENAEVNEVKNVYFTPMSVNEIKETDFSMIISNIQSRHLKSIMPDICNHISLHGIIILSGILVSERDEFVEFLKTQSLKFIADQVMGDWCSIECKKE